jgi:hypothetical protein
VADAFTLPAGWGFARLSLDQLRLRHDLLGTLQIWEPPGQRWIPDETPRGYHLERRRGDYRYVIGADVSDGIGLDRSAAAIHRMGTIEEEEEQVALYVNDYVTPVQFAYIIDALMGLYTDQEGYEALAAVECNNHGISTQDTLQLHLGRSNFYKWELLDVGDAKRRVTTKIGWFTSVRTRPMLLDKLYESLTYIDPVTKVTNLRVHAKILFDELADFQTEDDAAKAEAAKGAHDDVVMATAIAHYVAWRLQGGEQEPLSERRARLHAERAARDAAAPLAAAHLKRDWRNTGCTAEEWRAGVDPDEVSENLYDDARGEPLFLP